MVLKWKGSTMNARCLGCLLLAMVSLFDGRLHRRLSGRGSACSGRTWTPTIWAPATAAGPSSKLKPTDILSVDGRASWICFDDFDIQMIPLEAALRLNLPLLGERIVPYVGAGGGLLLLRGR